MWKLSELLRSSKRKKLDEEVRIQRGRLAHAVMTNDRRAEELRRVMAGALALREGYANEADR